MQKRQFKKKRERGSLERRNSLGCGSWVCTFWRKIFWIRAFITILACSLSWKQSPLWHFSKYFTAEYIALCMEPSEFQAMFQIKAGSTGFLLLQEMMDPCFMLHRHGRAHFTNTCTKDMRVPHRCLKASLFMFLLVLLQRDLTHHDRDSISLHWKWSSLSEPK